MPAPSSTSFNVVINYRRDDTAGHAGRLHDDLADHFGRRHVFIDIDAIEPGRDFTQAIERAVASADVFLALIGRNWLDAKDARGRRRLDDPRDFVRLEIEAALARDVRLIPVLVQGAEMPAEEELPPSLAPLAYRHAHELRDSSWGYDVDRLIRVLGPRRRRGWVLPAAAAAAAAALAVGVLLGLLLLRGEPQASPPPGGETAAPPGETQPQTEEETEPPPEEETRGGGILYAAEGGLFAVDGDGRPLALELPADAAAPDWSSDGSIAFVRGGDIWVADADGGDATRWTTGDGRDDAPAWSPDGERIAFNRTSRDPGARPDVWIVDAARNARDLTRGTFGAAPDWSPDGTRIVYQSEGQLFLVDAAGSGDRQRLEPLPAGTKLSPAWSPDGNLIAFAFYPTQGVPGIWVVSPEGGEPRAVTREPVDNPNFPDWSTDGDRLVFTARDGLWVVGLDGSGQRRLVRARGLSRPTWGPGE